MKTHRISVTVGTESIRVDPDTLTMTSKDEVSWAGTTSRGFSIVFDDDRLLGARELKHEAAKARHGVKAKGRFKYSVVSSENAKLRLDPVIVVVDPPTGSNP